LILLNMTTSSGSHMETIANTSVRHLQFAPRVGSDN
jgi:hypothetical protein